MSGTDPHESVSNPTEAEEELTARHIPLSTGDASAAWTEDKIDENAIITDDGRSLAHTRINYFEAPPEKQKKWRRIINNYHDGQTDPEKGKQNWQAGKKNDAKLFADHLDMTPEERDKLLEMAGSVEFQKFGSYSVEQVLAAACSLIIDENTDEYENRIILRDDFRELMEVVGIGSQEHRSIRQAIRERTDYF